MEINFTDYDRWLWRLNGTLLLVACAGAVLICFAMIIKVFLPTDNAAERAVEGNQVQLKNGSVLTATSFRLLRGNELILFPLRAEEGRYQSYSSTDTSTLARNYRVFNVRTKESAWAWKTNAQVVVRETEIYSTLENENRGRSLGLVLETVPADPHSSTAPAPDAKSSILYLDFASLQWTTLAENVTRSTGVQQVDSSEVIIFYHRDAQSYFRTFNVQTRSVSDEKQMTPPPSGASAEPITK